MVGQRSRRWGQGILVAVGVAVMFVLGLVFLAMGTTVEHPPLNTVVVPDAVIPSGFTRDADLSGPLDRQQLVTSGLSTEMADLATGYRGLWRNEASGQVLQVIAYDFGAGRRVAMFLRELRGKLAAAGLHVDRVPGIDGSVRSTGTVTTQAGPLRSSLTALGRGPLLFTVTVVGPDSSVSTSASAVTTAQVHRADDLYGRSPSTSYDAAEVAGAISVGVLGYLLLVGAWGWLRDPLRGSTGSVAWPATPPGTGVVIGTGRARSMRERALAVFILQLVGLTLIGCAFLPNSNVGRIGLALAGCLLLGVLAVSSGRARTSGWRRAIAWNAAATVAVVAAMASVSLAALSPDSPSPGSFTVASLFFFAAAGVTSRWGIRVSSLAAQETLARDPRPMVLFLRSFGDDRRVLRTAVLGRRSLLQKLGPRRFDSFEEVLVRHLTRVGPVVAISPPGTALAPIGAARATVSADRWQVQVDEWLAQAQLIVVGAPPEHVTEGLLWELQRITDRGLWDKVVLLVPPVPDDEARRRWQELAQAAGTPSPLQDPVPADPARTLALRFWGGQWHAAFAERRTEWTYAAALEALLPSAKAGMRADQPT
jgi:hypothetical protein